MWTWVCGALMILNAVEILIYLLFPSVTGLKHYDGETGLQNLVTPLSFLRNGCIAFIVHSRSPMISGFWLLTYYKSNKDSLSKQRANNTDQN